MNPAVVGIDVLERRVQEGRLVTDRLISSKWGIPGWAARLIGSPSVCYGYERSTVDPSKRQMEPKTRNVSAGQKRTGRPEWGGGPAARWSGRGVVTPTDDARLVGMGGEGAGWWWQCEVQWLD